MYNMEKVGYMLQCRVDGICSVVIIQLILMLPLTGQVPHLDLLNSEVRKQRMYVRILVVLHVITGYRPLIITAVRQVLNTLTMLTRAENSKSLTKTSWQQSVI